MFYCLFLKLTENLPGFAHVLQVELHYWQTYLVVSGQYEVGHVATQVLLTVRRNVIEQDVQEV